MKTYYFDTDFQKYDEAVQEEKELKNARWLLKSANPKLRKVGQMKLLNISGQYDEMPHSNQLYPAI